MSSPLELLYENLSDTQEDTYTFTYTEEDDESWNFSDSLMDTDLEVASALSSVLSAGEPAKSQPWPEDVRLYQPLEETQLLLPERASCLAVKTYLRMCQLPYGEHQCDNAEFMSPGGRLTCLPLLRLGQLLFTEFEPIVGHVEKTQPGHAISGWLSEEQREDMRIEVTYVENTLTLAEVHQCYREPSIYATYTKQRIGAVHPWPLSSLRRHEKRADALRLLRAYQWYELDAHGVQLELDKCCQLLNEKLSGSDADSQLSGGYLYGPRPCQLDALVFGHVAAILGNQSVSPMLSETVRGYPLVVAHCQRIDLAYHHGKQMPEGLC